MRDLIEGRLETADARGGLIRLSTQLIAEEALKAEQRDALGRDYFSMVRRLARAGATACAWGG